MKRTIFCFFLVLAACGSTSNDENAGRIDAEGATTLSIASGYCGGSFDQCMGRSATLVSLSAKTITTHVCVDGEGPSAYYGPKRGDHTNERALGDDAVRRVRGALAHVRFARANQTEQDGTMEGLTIDTPSGSQTLTPLARCGPSPYDQIVSGYDELRAVVDSL